MMKKLIKYIIWFLAIALTLFFSLKIEPLDRVIAERTNQTFDARAYAMNFMSKNIASLPAKDISEFLEQIGRDTEEYCKTEGKRLGISDDYNFIVEGNATVTGIETEYVAVALDNGKSIRLATDFIFGNAIRDGSSMADIGDFQNTMDFNSISVELNNIVREAIIPPFKQNVSLGDAISFKGAAKIDIKNPNLDKVRVIPVQITIIN